MLKVRWRMYEVSIWKPTSENLSQCIFLTQAGDSFLTDLLILVLGKEDVDSKHLILHGTLLETEGKDSQIHREHEAYYKTTASHTAQLSPPHSFID